MIVVGITGGTGFVGKNLLQTVDKAETVKFLPLTRQNAGDITESDFVNGSHNCDVVVHLAAKTFVPNSYDSPKAFYDTNITGTLNVLEYCKRNKIPLVFLSSYVYGNARYLPIDEKHPTDAFNPYAASKIVGEDLCNIFSKFHDVRSCVLRVFNLYGPHQPSHFFMPKLITGAINGSVSLGSSKPKRDYVHVQDLCNAIVSASQYLHAGGESLTANIGSGYSFSTAELADMVTSIYPNTVVRFTEEERANEVMDTLCDASLAKTKLSWEPSMPAAVGILEFIKFFKVT